MARERGRNVVATNRKARFDYSIEESIEAGLVLTGTEVKSLRLGRASLVDGYATVDGMKAVLHSIHIPEYTEGTWTNHTPRRDRPLLLHRKELERLSRQLKEGGLTLIPLALYFKDGYAKVELGLAKGRKRYDKRHAIAEREASHEARRARGRRAKGMDD